MGLANSVQFNFQMVTINCCNCGVPFGVPDYIQQRRQDDHHLFYCTNGHPQHYPQKNEVEELRVKLVEADEQIVKARRAKELAESTARMEAEQRRKAEKKLDRVNRGVCSKCNRTFANVARHMQSKHGVECNKPPKGSKVRA